MCNRLKLLLASVVLAVASGTAAAHSSVSFGISLGVPAPVYYAPAPAVYYQPAPVYYAPGPVYYAPAYYYGPPAVVIRTHRGFHHRRHW